jgi:hypothetical protein
MTKSGQKLADAKTRIEWAEKIIGSKWNRESVESCIGAMLNHERRAERLNAELKAEREQPQNKEERKAVGRVADDLRRLNAALRNSELPTRILKSLPTDLLQKRQKELEEIAKRPLKKPKAPDPNPKKKKKRPARTNLRWWAARYASMTLQELGIERTTTRGGMLHKLASAYYGDEKADLFDYIRVYYKLDHLDARED